LQTTDKDLATLRSAQCTVHFQKLVLKLKKDGTRMTPAEIDSLISRWMDTALQKTEDVRVQYTFDDDQREVMTDLAIDKYQDFALTSACDPRG
jgi:hypothetical protein